MGQAFVPKKQGVNMHKKCPKTVKKALENGLFASFYDE